MLFLKFSLKKNFNRFITLFQTHPLYSGCTNVFSTILFCSLSSVFPSICLPASIRYCPPGLFGDRVLQWPAVRTHPAASKVPPHTCRGLMPRFLLNQCKDTCHGWRPSSASSPPTIRVGRSASRANWASSPVEFYPCVKTGFFKTQTI